MTFLGIIVSPSSPCGSRVSLGRYRNGYQLHTARGVVLNHARPSDAAAKNEYSYTSTPPVYINGMFRGDLYLYLTLHAVTIHMFYVFRF
jgi:hypothetical protein